MHQDSFRGQPWICSIVRVAATIRLTKLPLDVKGQWTEQQNLQWTVKGHGMSVTFWLKASISTRADGQFSG